MKRRTISHFFEQKNLIKRRRMALLDKHTSLSRRVEANSQSGELHDFGEHKFIKKGRS